MKSDGKVSKIVLNLRKKRYLMLNIRGFMIEKEDKMSWDYLDVLR